MEVILLERVPRLGQMGDVVRVKDGFARNYLLPQGKALRANKQNRQRFEAQRSQLEANNLERKQEADAVAEKLGGQSFIAIRQAGESGQLYGSVSTRDISELLTEGGFTLSRNQVNLNMPIKSLGLHEVEISLHPEVAVTVTINVARSEDEAARQARGEDVTRSPEEEEMEDLVAAAEEVFEDEALAQEAVQEFIEEGEEETPERGAAEPGAGGPGDEEDSEK